MSFDLDDLRWLAEIIRQCGEGREYQVAMAAIAEIERLRRTSGETGQSFRDIKGEIKDRAPHHIQIEE